MNARSLIAILLSALAVAGAGCRKRHRAAKTPPKPKPPVVATVRVDKPTVTIGDTVRYTIEVESAPGIAVTFPDFGANLAGFVIKDFGMEGPRKRPDGRVVRKKWCLLDTYLTGPYNIPPATIRYKGKDGREHEVKTTDLFVEVKSAAEKGETATDIRDIQEPVPVAGSYAALYAAGGGLLALALLVAAAVHIRRRRKAAKVVPPPPAHEVAYEQLRRLLAKNYIEQGKTKEFYYELSDIVRHYIEDRFDLRAPELTTEEFLSELAGSDALHARHKSLLQQFLQQCDLVKFAKYNPNEEENEKAYAAARRLIDETKDVGEEEEAEDREEQER